MSNWVELFVGTPFVSPNATDNNYSVYSTFDCMVINETEGLGVLRERVLQRG